MTIFKAMIKFQSFIAQYGDLSIADEAKIDDVTLSFFGKRTTAFEIKFDIAVRLGYYEIHDESETVSEYYVLTEKGAEFLKKREDVQLKWRYGVIGSIFGIAATGTFELIKYLIERFSYGG